MLDKPMTHEAPSEPNILRYRTPRRLKLVGLIGGSVVALAVVLGLMTRFVSGQETRDWTKEQAIPAVHLLTLQGAQGGDFTLPGDVQAFYTATIYAQITGYVQKWFTDIGAPVKAGQLLAQIDPRPYQAALDQAQGQLAKDQAALAGAESGALQWRIRRFAQKLQGRFALVPGRRVPDAGDAILAHRHEGTAPATECKAQDRSGMPHQR